MIVHYAFGSKLRMHRERQGVSLASIAESTKIKLSLLEALEQGNVSQWPRGLFRRAYLRDYAAAIGVPAEPLVAEFMRLFPEEGQPSGAAPADVEESPEPLRLSFPTRPELGPQPIFENVPSALAELVGVVAVGMGIAWAAQTAVLGTCGVVALVYYPIGTALTGRVLSLKRLQWLARRTSLLVRTPVAAPAVASAGATAPPPIDMPEPTLYLVPKSAQTPMTQVPAPLPLVALGVEPPPAEERRTAAV